MAQGFVQAPDGSQIDLARVAWRTKGTTSPQIGKSGDFVVMGTRQGDNWTYLTFTEEGWEHFSRHLRQGDYDNLS